MNLIIRDHQGNWYDSGIPLNKIKRIDVFVFSGDEIIHIHDKDGFEVHLDAQEYSGHHRSFSVLDRAYSVRKKYLPIWNFRKDSYSWNNNENRDGEFYL